MKIFKNIPAAICFALALVFLALACVGVNLDAEAVQNAKTEPVATQAPTVSYDSSLSDASRVDVLTGTISDAPAPTQKASSFDFSGKIVDGKVQGSEKSTVTAAPTQKASSFDFSGTIVDGKVQSSEATAAPEPEAPAQAAGPAEAAVEQPSRVHVFLVDYAGTLALIGFIFLGLWLVCLCVVPMIQAYKRDKLTFENLNAGQRVLKMFTLAPNKWAMYLLITIIVAGLIAWSSSSIEWKGLASKGSEVAYGIVHGITHPDMSYILSLGSDKVPYLMMQTIAIALLGTIFGGILAIPVAFLCAENVVPKWVAFIVRALVLAIRTIPSIIWALCWIRVTGPGPLCGVMTQSICSIGMISKMYTTAIEDLDTRILESLDAAGCNTFQKIRYGILPQLTANFISTIIYRFDINLKDATTLGIVGAGGIGASLIQAINSRRWGIVGAFLCGMIALMLVIEFISTRIRAKLAHGE